MTTHKWLFSLLLLNCIFRLVNLAEAPPGFYFDEARAAAHAICLGQTGSDLAGRRLPFYSTVEGTLQTTRRGGLYPATWTYPAAVWTSVFGNTRSSFRSLSAFVSILALVVLYWLMRLFVNIKQSLIVVLVMAYMPASFQLSRLAWENTLIPFFLISGMFFLFRSCRAKWRFEEWLFLLGSALAFDLAMLSYPAPRLQLPLLLPVLLWARNLQKRWTLTDLLVFCAALFVFAVPYFHGILEGYLLARFNAVSIFDAKWLSHYWVGPGEETSVSGGKYYAAALTAFTWKFLLHFSPGFLFRSGDVNPRHSPQFVGELGFLEAAAVGFALLKLFGAVTGRYKIGSIKESSYPTFLKWLCAAGVISGFIPSALTKESPHALRSIGAIPFIAIWAGLQLQELLAITKTKKLIRAALVAGSITFFTFFFCSYYRYYPEIASNDFAVEMLDLAVETKKTGKWRDFVREPSFERNRFARSYYAMSMGNLRCEVVRPWIFESSPSVIITRPDAPD